MATVVVATGCRRELEAKPELAEQIFTYATVLSLRMLGALRRTICVLAASLSVNVGAALSQPVASQEINRAELAAFVDGFVEDATRRDHIAGVSVAIVGRSGALVEKGYGLADLEPKRSVDSQTLFRVGSISKTIVWIAIMQLVETGAVSLDDPVNDHLPPALRIPDESDFEPVRVRDLLSHTAGFEDSALGHLFINDPGRLSTLESYLQRYRVRRVRQPGLLSVYSNYGAVLAGALVTHTTGLAWPDYAEQRIFRPLGMTTASFREPYSTEVAASRGLPTPMSPDLAMKLTRGFRWQNVGLVAQPFEYVTQASPAGSMSASAADMAAYMAALLDPERLVAAGVLAAQTAHALREPLFSNREGFGSWRHGFMDVPIARPDIAFGHNGDTVFQHSSMMIFPKQGVGIFVSVNTPTGVSLRTRLAEAIVNRFFGVTQHTIVKNHNSLKDLQRFAGDYLTLRRPYYRTERAIFRLLPANVSVASDRGLIATFTGEPKLYAPIGPDIFEEVGGSSRIAFQEIDGVMRAFDPDGAGPLDRVGIFQSIGWLLLVGGAAHVTAALSIWDALRRLLTNRPAAFSLAFSALGTLWLISSGVMFVSILPWAGSDFGAIMFNYPGDLFPIGCWLLLIASIATPAATAACCTLWRPTRWPEWVGITFGSVAYLGFAATLYDWGFLGFFEF